MNIKKPKKTNSNNTNNPNANSGVIVNGKN